MLVFFSKKRDEMYWIKRSVYFSMIISFIFLLAFMYGREPFTFIDYILDTDVVGQYGDFVGGVIGTILSVVLLYSTFKMQHQDAENHMKVYKEESLYKLFFHMLESYNNIMNRFTVRDVGDNELRGKEALHYYYEAMYTDFQPANYKRFNLNRKIAVNFFQTFYDSTLDVSPVFFRTVYGALKLLDTDDKDTETERIKLMKVLRTQMTSTELIMLRYNSMTKEGKKSSEPLRRFNLLKHLPLMDLMEYKPWGIKMTFAERNRINRLLYFISQNIKKVLNTDSSQESYSNDQLAFNTHVSTNEKKTELQLCLYINEKQLPNKASLILGIRKLTSDERLALLEQFLKDYFLSTTGIEDYKKIRINSTVNSANDKWNVKVTKIDGSSIKC